METLLLILIVLKVFGLISLSWVWLLGPIGVLALVGLAIVLVGAAQTGSF